MTVAYDAVVAGGGPAGAAAAIVLARAGRSVLLCEAGDGEERKVGEALPPAARPLLRDLGVLDAFARDGHLPSYGNVARWGADEPYAVDFLRDPNGHGWHVDRVRFEDRLRACARAAGAEVRMGTGLRLAAGPSPWELEARDGSRVRAQVVVDATGRRASLARALGARRVRRDRLVALHAVLDASPDDADARTFLSGCEDGWWYAALVPGGRRVVAHLTDADLVAPEVRTAGGFAAALRDTGLAGDAEHAAAPRATAAHGAHLSAAAGEGWAAVGDAALACDPLSSQGMLTALYTGLTAGTALAELLAGGDDAPLEAYADRVGELAAAYARNRGQTYAYERRWPDSPFWTRRLGATALHLGV